jgi:hypothetical protein
MSAEDMDRTVSSNPFLYDQLKSLGVSADVWDDVLDELFDEPFGNVPGPFGLIQADLNGKLDHNGWITRGPKAFPTTTTRANC